MAEKINDGAWDLQPTDEDWDLSYMPTSGTIGD